MSDKRNLNLWGIGELARWCEEQHMTVCINDGHITFFAAEKLPLEPATASR